MSPTRELLSLWIGVYHPDISMCLCISKYCQVNWGDPRSWDLDPACPKNVAEASWSHHEEELKDRHSTASG